MMPRLGLVIEWRHRASGWWALVAYVDEARSCLSLEWFRASRLWPNLKGRYDGTDEPY